MPDGTILLVRTQTPLGRHATVRSCSLRPWRSTPNTPSAIRSSIVPLLDLDTSRVYRMAEHDPDVSLSLLRKHLQASPSRPRALPAHHEPRLGFHQGISPLSVPPPVVALAPRLVTPSVLPPPSRRITPARLRHDDWLMERPLEDFARGGAGRSCGGLLFPHLFGLDADVVYLLLPGVNALA
jgi:hypothetical protein